MSPETLESLSDDDLRATVERAQVLLQERAESKKREAMEKAHALLAAVGLTFEDALTHGRQRARSKEPTRAAARKLHAGEVYANPANPSQTWTVGRGRKPGWVVELESTVGLPAPISSAKNA